MASKRGNTHLLERSSMQQPEQVDMNELYQLSQKLEHTLSLFNISLKKHLTSEHPKPVNGV